MQAPATRATTWDEVVHTTASHPWLTADRGWEQAGVLQVGEAVVRVDGSTGVVVALRVVPGAANMWDLTVSNVHTFAVGSGAYVVHNCANPGGGPPGTKIVGTPNGYNVPVPDNWPSRVADNGKGIVFQEPGASVRNANSVRIMDPTPMYPEGYLRYYNQSGQPLDIFGRPGPQQATHIPLDVVGGASGYYNWLLGFP